MATIVKNWANGDPLTLETSAGGISVLSAPNLTGVDREMDITVRTTNPNGAKASKLVRLVQSKREASWWEDYLGVRREFDLENTPIANFCTSGDDSSMITINGSSIAKNTVKKISFGDDYNSVVAIPGFFLMNFTSLLDVNITGLRKTASFGAYAFSSCKSLPLLSFQGFSQLLTISGLFINNCSSILDVDMRESVNIQSFDMYAISANALLKTITIGAIIPPTLGHQPMINNPSLQSIFVPAESVELYKAATNWNLHASKIKPL